MKQRSIDLWYSYLGYLAQICEAQGRVGGIVLIGGLGLVSAGGAGINELLTGSAKVPILAPLVLLIPILLLSGILLLAGFAYICVTGCRVTRRVCLVNLPGGLEPAQSPHGMWVSGIFQLEERRWQDFVFLPCGCARQQSGDLTFFQNVDASVYTMGLRMVSAAGIWTLSIPPRSSEVLVVGLQYWASAARPAVRLRVHYPKRVGEVVIACGTIAELRGLMRELTDRGLLRS